jgi:type II secretory pathway component PulL
MAQNINLLPPEFSPQKVYIDIAKRIKKFAIIIFLFLLIVVASSAASLFILARQISSLSGKQDELTEQINSLKKSEAQVIILKDRADKSKTIFDSNLTRDSLDAFNSIEAQTSAGIEYVGLTLEDKHITVSVKAANSSELEQFVTFLLNSKIFQKIYLTEMSFNKNGGYDASFTMEI